MTKEEQEKERVRAYRRFCYRKKREKEGHEVKMVPANFTSTETAIKRERKKRYDLSILENPMDLKGFENWLREKEMAENSVKSYVTCVKIFGQQYDEFSKENVVEFKKTCCKKYKPQTTNHYIVALQQYSVYLDKPIKVKLLKEQHKSSVENVMSEDIFNELIKKLKEDNRDRELINIMLLAMTGARISEALSITKKDVLKGSVVLQTKGKVRTIIIPKKFKEFLQPYMQEWNNSEPVMRKKCSDKAAVSSSYIQQQLRDIGRDYGIPLEYMHPHAFRHYFAMRFLEKNNNMFLLADLLGHSGVNTTMIYTRMSQKQQKQALDEAVDWDI